MIGPFICGLLGKGDRNNSSVHHSTRSDACGLVRVEWVVLTCVWSDACGGSKNDHSHGTVIVDIDHKCPLIVDGLSHSLFDHHTDHCQNEVPHLVTSHSQIPTL